MADAGPLIHLSEINALFLLRLFEMLHIPQTVWLETVGQGRVAQADLVELNNLKNEKSTETEVARFVRDNDLEGLHRGECESLYVCQQINIPIILTDDLAVRETAKRLKLTPVGSLGIVIRSYQTGIISLDEAERNIFDLQDISTLFVTRAVVELAVEELHRRAEG